RERQSACPQTTRHLFYTPGWDDWAKSPRLLGAYYLDVDPCRNCTAALIEQDHGPFLTSRIFIRPTIQSYMAHQDRMSADVRDRVHDACYDFVLRHKSIPDDPKFKSDLEALASEETNVQGLLMGIPVDTPRPNARHLQRLSVVEPNPARLSPRMPFRSRALSRSMLTPCRRLRCRRASCRHRTSFSGKIALHPRSIRRGSYAFWSPVSKSYPVGRTSTVQARRRCRFYIPGRTSEPNSHTNLNRLFGRTGSSLP
ncbi:hypothetical protein C8R45DRAFT_1009932, partial [Mycena sanguinolenta]